jgi:hypothetical protein
VEHIITHKWQGTAKGKMTEIHGSNILTLARQARKAISASGYPGSGSQAPAWEPGVEAKLCFATKGIYGGEVTEARQSLASKGVPKRELGDEIEIVAARLKTLRPSTGKTPVPP